MKTVVVTGANRGIGLEFVKQYARAGWNVIAGCRNPDLMPEEMLELPTAHVEELDVSSTGSISRLVERWRHGPIDVLINNAAIYGPDESEPGQWFPEVDIGILESVLRVNTIGPIAVTQAFLPMISASKEKKVVSLSSKMGSVATLKQQSRYNAIAYRTSKAALNIAMVVMAEAIRSDNIAAYIFSPGWCKTDMGGQNATLDPATSVRSMRELIARFGMAESGSYFNWDGAPIPW